MVFPAEYGVSGVKTFLVNHQGVVYQKDLGLATTSTARPGSRGELMTPDERITELEESTQELALSISRTLDVLAQCCRQVDNKKIRDVALELEAIRFSKELEEAAKRNAE